MKGSIASRLAENGVTLGSVPGPTGAYTATLTVGDLLFTSGQVAADTQGRLVATGVLGADVDLDTGIACARQCAVNVVRQVAAALGDLDRVRRVVKLTVYIASAAGFTDQPRVANGASELINDVFGEIGIHTRSAVGVAALPSSSPVEVEAILQIEGATA